MNAESQETSITPPASNPESVKAPPHERINLIRRMMDNPVILKELRGRMRNRQAFVLLTVYLALISLFIVMIYNTLFGITNSVMWDPSVRQTAGKAIFGTVVLLELLLLSFIAPGLTAGSITAERERQTFDLLRTTLLPARALVFGKLGSALMYLFLLILTALPIQSLAFLLGGVGLGEMVASSVMLLVTATFYCTLGIFFSSFMKRTLAATVSSYAAILTSFLILVIVFILIAYVESLSYSSGVPGLTRAYVLISIIWFLISTNPLMAAVISEMILVDQQSLFFTSRPLFGSSGPSYLPSPWIVYVGLYFFLTLVLMFWSVHNVKKPEK